MIKLIAVCLMSFTWYGPGGGSLRSSPPPRKTPKTQTSVRWRTYNNLYEIKIKDSYGSRTIYGRGPLPFKVITNPYVRKK